MTPGIDPRVRHTREAVHDAVLDLIRENGLAAVRHALVAERAGVARATVYRHWPDRAALLVSTLEALRPQIEAPEPSGDVRVDVRRLVDTFASHLNDNEMLADLLVLLREADDDPELAVVRQHVIPIEGNPLRTLVEAGRVGGVLRDDVPVEVQIGMVLGPMLAYRLVLRRALTDDVLDGIVTTWFEGSASADVRP